MGRLFWNSPSLLIVCAFIGFDLPGFSQTQPASPNPQSTSPDGRFQVIRPKSSANPSTPASTQASSPTQPTPSTPILTTDPANPKFFVIRPTGSTTANAGSSVITIHPNSTRLPEPQGSVPHLEIVRPSGTTSLPKTNSRSNIMYDLPEPTPGAKSGENVVFESWDAAFCRGYKVGHFHVVVTQVEKNGKKLLYSSKTVTLTVARFGQQVEMVFEDTMIETLDGQILVAQMRQGIGKNQALVITGTVEGKKMAITIEGQTKEKTEITWPENVISISKETSLFKDRKPKPGTQFEYLSYEARLTRILQYTATIKEPETVTIGESQKTRKLIPIIQEMKPVGEFKLPPATVWVDAETFDVVKMESDMPTLGGKLTVIRTTRDAALRAPVKYLDLAEAQSIKLNRTVANIHKSNGVVYKVTLGGDTPMDKAFPSDLRQEIKSVDAKARTLEIHTSGIQSPLEPKIPPVAPDAEFLSDCFFIDWDNELVKKHANAAIANLPANATDWRKALAVESWVRKNMVATEFSQAMATCANVAKSLSGDCTEYSVLAAGMCRALKIPSRTAIGLVYAPDKNNQPTLAYHMWFEIWYQGQWMSLDSTLGMGGIGPGHIKISDASWHNEKSFAPILPVLTILGANPKIEIINTAENK